METENPALAHGESEKHDHAAKLINSEHSAFKPVSQRTLIPTPVGTTVLAFDYTVVPGISSVAALAAAHRISLTRVGRPVQITTGRLLADLRPPPGVDDVVVMRDASTAFTTVTDDDTEIFWGAYLGTPDEILIAGPVRDVADRIVAERAEARRRKGWIMDTYLLRRGQRE